MRGNETEENPKLRAPSVLWQHLVLHQSRNNLRVSSLTAFLRLSLFLCLRVCVFDDLTTGGLWSDCVAVLSQSQ